MQLHKSNWKLEASNDNVEWTQLDQQINRDWVSGSGSEVYFPVNTKKSFFIFQIHSNCKRLY
jgi:hypothetical protein